MADADPPRVLVVDDAPRYGMAVTALLEAAGMTVVGRAEDGATALLLAKALVPDVVTMDVHMPAMNGVETTRRLRRQHPDLPVILVTGSDSHDLVRKALAISGVSYMKKRDAHQALPFVIRRIIEQHR